MNPWEEHKERMRTFCNPDFKKCQGCNQEYKPRVGMLGLPIAFCEGCRP